LLRLVLYCCTRATTNPSREGKGDDMDARKRPRSSTPTKEGTPTKKKNKKDKNKTKKTKRNRSNSMDGTTSTVTPKPKNSMDSTATTDGQMMAQMLSTFSKIEQSRFEAFQRVSFRVDAVGDWVAGCLSHRLGAQSNLPLEDLVASGQAGEIRTVVAVLAKTYTQRLVQAAAKMVASKTTNNPNVMDPMSGGPCLQPSDILRALEERQAQGLDPGFFLQNANERPSLVLEPKESFEQKRLAAFQAQEEYDRQVEQRKQSADAESSKDQMDIDSKK